MRKFYMACAAALVMAGAGAPALAAKKPQLTPMQIQAMQQKEFEAPKAALFSSVVDVFQDLGYTINSADMASGFITAESATVNKTGFWDGDIIQSVPASPLRARTKKSPATDRASTSLALQVSALVSAARSPQTRAQTPRRSRRNQRRGRPLRSV